jgi:N-methylhydantoinase B
MPPDDPIESPRAVALDPVTLAVIQNGLQQVCNEMDLAFVRAAFSPVIAEALDRSDGIYHRDSGELIAQGELGLPVFVGTMQFSTQAVIERVRAGNVALEPGDVFIVNDPYLGGTHLMDVKFVKPFFYRGRLWCWLANTGHWPDVGGIVPGGFSANATEVEQEGLRLPPVKLFKAGKLDAEILAIIFSNIRIADQRIGDVKAQAAALAIGERRLAALLDRYGADTVDRAVAELRARASRQMRAKIAAIPEGVYEGESFVDSDGVVDAPLRIAMRIEKRGESLAFDMAGSSPPCRGPMNSVIATTKSSIYLAMKHVFPDVPINAGMFEPLAIVEPEGTFLYAKYPRPVSGCAAEVSQRIAEAVFGALVKAIPQDVFAAPAGTSGNLSVGGYDPARKRSYVMYVISGGGYGGSPRGDGLSNGCSTIGISKTTPIEVMEQYYPVLFEEYSLHEGSGGAGERRGGFGVNYRIRLRRGEARASMVMDHGRFGPQGAAGGEDGGVNRVRIVRRGEAYVPPHLSKDQDIRLEAGDVIEVSTPGGGGFGDPRRRPPERVAQDVAKGYYTREQAAARFGVAVSAAGELDGAATAALRATGNSAAGGRSRVSDGGP